MKSADDNLTQFIQQTDIHTTKRREKTEQFWEDIKTGRETLRVKDKTKQRPPIPTEDLRATPNDELELSSSTDSSITNPASAEPQKKPMRGHKRVSSMPDKSSILGKTKTPTATEGQKKQAPTVIVTKVEAKESNKLDKKSKEKSNKSKKLIGEKVASKKDKTKDSIQRGHTRTPSGTYQMPASAPPLEKIDKTKSKEINKKDEKKTSIQLNRRSKSFSFRVDQLLKLEQERIEAELKTEDAVAKEHTKAYQRELYKKERLQRKSAKDSEGLRRLMINVSGDQWTQNLSGPTPSVPPPASTSAALRSRDNFIPTTISVCTSLTPLPVSGTTSTPTSTPTQPMPSSMPLSTSAKESKEESKHPSVIVVSVTAPQSNEVKQIDIQSTPPVSTTSGVSDSSSAKTTGNILYKSAESKNEEESKEQKREDAPIVQLLKKIGRGATATVWKGILNNKVVALKQISLHGMSKTAKQKLRKKFKLEMEIVQRLEHPNILKYLGSFYSRQNQEINVVMEFIDGVCVTDLIVYQKKLTEAMASHLTKQILCGLQFLHQNNIVHRDVKPDNMLLSFNPTVLKIIDFGTAALLLPECPKRKSAVGTPWYCAPEVVNSEEYASSCDIWSLGCTLIEFISGKPPYDDLNDVACLFKMAEKNTPPLPSVSKECEEFLRLCLRPAANERPNAQALLTHSFIQMYIPQEQTINAEISKIIQEMIEAKALLEATTRDEEKGSSDDDNTPEGPKERRSAEEPRRSF